jgi:hypothetical protein
LTDRSTLTIGGGRDHRVIKFEQSSVEKSTISVRQTAPVVWARLNPASIAELNLELILELIFELNLELILELIGINFWN